MSQGVTAPYPGAMEQHPGIIYSFKNDVVAPTCSRTFWFLHKSKKVWFRLDERYRGMNIEPSFFYRGQLILYRGDLATFPMEERKSLEATSIVWGKHVSNGWGWGPEGTNYFLNLLTRWSVFQPARCHPEYFSMTHHLPFSH
ncbi:hypothetical protein [Cyanobium gracile]|uniref:Uncharacterized protein n=1 Tax=Cyanobium gracile UHCC 0281 TaxID=3110309 RepID=A0ABU5SU69_9CYAN|nr:hypothetical protein [Cyanobium gracile]MEA5442016.1 hypothetical protein [Cyanobium gracile UHCC 0281]